MIRSKILRSLILFFSFLLLLSCSDGHHSSSTPPDQSQTPQQDENQTSDDSRFGAFPDSEYDDDDRDYYYDDDDDDDNNFTDSRRQEQSKQVKSIKEQLQQKQPVNEAPIIQKLDIIPSTDINSSSMSELKKKVFTKLINKERIDFSDITNLLIEEQVRYYNTDGREHDKVSVEEIRSIIENIASKIYINTAHIDNITFDLYNEWCKNYSFKEEYLKKLYETELESLSSSKDPMLYNSRANSIPYIFKDRRIQDYSSTILHLLISRYDPCFNIKDNVVIFEKNHVLPGYLVEYIKGKNLHPNLTKVIDRIYDDYALSVSFRRSHVAIGVETSTKGLSAILYKDIENYKDSDIRIVDAELFTILEIFKNDIFNIKEVSKQVIDLTAKKYGIDPKINYKYDDFSYNGIEFPNSDNSPLCLETYNIKKGYTRYRSTLDGIYTKQKLLKEQKEQIKIQQITRNYVLTKDGNVLDRYGEKPITQYYIQHLGLDNISTDKPPLTNVRYLVDTKIDSDFTVALKNDGTVVSLNATKGNPNYSDTDYASANGSLTNVKKVVSTTNAFAALKEDGTVVSWGKKQYGGDPNYNYDGNGTIVKKANESLTDIEEIVSNQKSFAALKKDGTVIHWGEIYDYSDDTKERPFTELIKQFTNVKQLVSNHYAYAALKEDGTVITWGDKFSGGHPYFDNSDVSQANGHLDHVVKLFSSEESSFFIALKDDGSILVWGKKYEGGDPNYSRYDYANVKGDLTDIKKVALNNYAVVVVKKDGSILTWGSKYVGGDPSYSDYSTLAAFEKLENVEDVYVRGYAFVAYKADGSFVSWGKKEHIKVLEEDYGLID